MNRFALTLIQIIGLIAIFVIDRSFQGVFKLFDFFSITILLLMILLNLNSSKSFISLFLVFGLLVDWANKSFLGVTSLVAIVLLYVYYIVVKRFAGNKVSVFIVNLITSYLLFIAWINYQHIFSWQALVNSIIVLLVTSIMWLR